ncbi:raffinose/stachyose/melibiose transport system permease protein [Thermosporothrix hazakensis]|uniref:Raffinose/stachyose/melibiose transport system permease protein n=2 Tax=Thermosporothrix TaxID=768650 RepID=A0A326UBR4_THEHA|nr:carbohydrate ABC transporter permease [Thermosporothrix hazakensis]PZW32815.1 raffinose/stachyose/melibiose transport system permease protein [Thermosporothrix hazakensis]BBH87732.1 sugar ABC transporter permease [Thermosporothrix sp. COM3]GCE50171.1 sugar ABC transporter permease [Thermosporothrix hazakensis]
MAVSLHTRRPRIRLKFGRLLTHLVLFVGGILWMYPFLWTLGSSFKSVDGFFDEGLSIFPREFEWTNYVNAWNEASFSQYFFNTIFVTVFTVILTVIFTAMAGYVLARKEFPGKKLFLGLVALTMFLPHGYTIIPVFDIVQRLGLLDTLWSVILVQTAGGMVFNTFLFMGYFSSMQRELEDAARVDGASFHQLFWRVMLPLSGPMIATVALFTFIGTWNSFFVPLVFTLGVPELRTLAVGMFAFVGQNSTQWTYLCAGSVITLAPIIFIFVLLQSYFINGVAGAIKS